jgi:hypothetical protein
VFFQEQTFDGLSAMCVSTSPDSRRVIVSSARQGHVEAVQLYPDNAGMPHGLRDRTSRLRRRRLQLTVGPEGELLSDRGGQNAQSY